MPKTNNVNTSATPKVAANNKKIGGHHIVHPSGELFSREHEIVSREHDLVSGAHDIKYFTYMSR